MADIFISYAREDREAAHVLADLFIKRGLSVWWDRDLVAGGDMHKIIERQLHDAAQVIVLWSKHSAPSHWVRGEADFALSKDKLLPVKIDACDIPINFRPLNTPEFTDWMLGARSPHLTEFIEATNNAILQRRRHQEQTLEFVHKDPFLNRRPAVAALWLAMFAAATAASFCVILDNWYFNKHTFDSGDIARWGAVFAATLVICWSIAYIFFPRIRSKIRRTTTSSGAVALVATLTLLLNFLFVPLSLSSAGQASIGFLSSVSLLTFLNLGAFLVLFCLFPGVKRRFLTMTGWGHEH